jgi:hypothetical protein
VFEAIVGAAVGAWWVARSKPKTKAIKSHIVGSKTGHLWTVEFFEDLGAMVVMHDGTKVVFRKTPTGWEPIRRKGNPQVAHFMVVDFGRPAIANQGD